MAIAAIARVIPRMLTASRVRGNHPLRAFPMTSRLEAIRSMNIKAFPLAASLAQRVRRGPGHDRDGEHAEGDDTDSE
jgi:hypothetical protein